MRETDERFAATPGSGRLVTVAVCRKPGETQHVQAMLSSAGIRSFVQGEHASALAGGWLSARILVEEEQVDQATELLGGHAAETGETPAPLEQEGSGSGRLVWVLFALFVAAMLLMMQRASG